MNIYIIGVILLGVLGAFSYHNIKVSGLESDIKLLTENNTVLERNFRECKIVNDSSKEELDKIKENYKEIINKYSIKEDSFKQETEQLKLLLNSKPITEYKTITKEVKVLKDCSVQFIKGDKDEISKNFNNIGN